MWQRFFSVPLFGCQFFFVDAGYAIDFVWSLFQFRKKWFCGIQNDFWNSLDKYSLFIRASSCVCVQDKTLAFCRFVYLACQWTKLLDQLSARKFSWMYLIKNRSRNFRNRCWLCMCVALCRKSGKKCCPVWFGNVEKPELWAPLFCYWWLIRLQIHRYIFTHTSQIIVNISDLNAFVNFCEYLSLTKNKHRPQVEKNCCAMFRQS